LALRRERSLPELGSQAAPENVSFLAGFRFSRIYSHVTYLVPAARKILDGHRNRDAKNGVLIAMKVENNPIRVTGQEDVSCYLGGSHNRFHSSIGFVGEVATFIVDKGTMAFMGVKEVSGHDRCLVLRSTTLGVET
jgi:hypothetical protein